MSQFFGGALDPTWPHAILIAGTIIGGALVGLGVILEAPKIVSIPVAAVFVGVVIEAACTLLLFGFDEGISRTQNDKIIALEEQLAPRLVEQGLSARTLSKFAGTPFLVESLQDSEPKRTGDQIRWLLDHAGWTRYILHGGEFGLMLNFTYPDSVTVHIMASGEAAWRAQKASDALISVLTHNPLGKIEAREGYSMPFFDDQGKTVVPKPGDQSRLGIIIVEVGLKPLPKSLQLPTAAPKDERGNEIWGNTAE